MERNKLEEQMQQKLASRTLTPSEGAWDRLDAMLTATEKPKRKFNWLSIAAVFLGFTVIGAFLLPQEKTIVPTVENAVVVEENTGADNAVATPQTVVSQIAAKATEAVASHTAQPAKPVSQPTTSGAINPKKDFIIDYAPAKEQVAVTKAPEGTKAKFIDATALLAQVEGNAQGTITTPVVKKGTVTVSANSLLSSAEEELNESFRSKVIESINKNYNSVKSTLANRNSQ